MRKLWEFYENLNEIVYVTDIETDEIVYLNRRARQQLGFPGLKEAQGKKCYEAIQNSQFPCAFCNNDRLRRGSFEEWTYFHPVFKKKFALKDTLIEEDGRRYRMEMAIDLSPDDYQDHSGVGSLDNEAVINEGLRIALASPTADGAIDLLLEYLGKVLKSERAYIFEENQELGVLSNTYEWCAEGVVPQKDELQTCTMETLEIWYERFRNNQNVIIRNLEDTRESDPMMYDYLLPQDIHSLVVSPLVYEKKIIGFYGVDNPPAELMDNISMLFQITGYFIVLLLRRSYLFRRLEDLSFHDRLTGLGNRHLMDEFFKSQPEDVSIGIVYCDVMGLKVVNDTMGHQAGDELLLRACRCLKNVFYKYSLFRIGGDEFLVLCSGIDSETLEKKVAKLKERLHEDHAMMAVGSVWRPDSSENMDKLLMEADSHMYEDKRGYYEKNNRDRRRGS